MLSLFLRRNPGDTASEQRRRFCSPRSAPPL